MTDCAVILCSFQFHVIPVCWWNKVAVATSIRVCLDWSWWLRSFTGWLRSSNGTHGIQLRQLWNCHCSRRAAWYAIVSPRHEQRSCDQAPPAWEAAKAWWCDGGVTIDLPWPLSEVTVPAREWGALPGAFSPSLLLSFPGNPDCVPVAPPNPEAMVFLVSLSQLDPSFKG